MDILASNLYQNSLLVLPFTSYTVNQKFPLPERFGAKIINSDVSNLAGFFAASTIVAFKNTFKYKMALETPIVSDFYGFIILLLEKFWPKCRVLCNV